MLTMVVLQSQAWDNLMARLDALLGGAAQGLLSFLLAILVVAIGWGVATLASAAARILLRAVRFNDGVRSLVGGGPMRHEPAAMAAWGVYWLIMVAALMFAIDTMGFTLSISVTDRLAEVLPRIIASAVLLAVGVLVAMLVGAVTRRFFDTAGLRGGQLRGQIVTIVLSGFAVLVSLEQLGFAAQFVMAIGLVALSAVGIALGLAFGLGCRDLARDFIVEYLRSLDEQGPQRPA
jgi:hypothetical protein